MPQQPPPPPESGEPAAAAGDKAECLRLLAALPSAASASPSFRRHWPSISASLSSLSASLSHPAFPPSAADAPLLSPLAAALSALVSVADVPASLGHLHTVSLVSSSAAELSHLAADARLLVVSASPPPLSSVGSGSGGAEQELIPRLRLGSATSRAAALDELVLSVASLPPSSAAAAVSAVAAMLDSGEILPSSREKAVSVLAAFASSDTTCALLAREADVAVVPHLCRALESGGAAAAEHACVALTPLTATSRDAAAAVAARGGVGALLATCALGTPAAQAAAAGVLRNLAAYPNLVPVFRDENAVPSLLHLVSLGTPRAQEMALGCLRNLTAGDGDECERLKVEAFQEGALARVKEFLESCVAGDEPGLAPAFGLLRNMSSFRYIAEIALSASFVDHVVATLGCSDSAATRTEAAMALAELCNIRTAATTRGTDGVGDAVPRLVWMLEAKAVAERDAAARALAALVGAASVYRKLFKKEERGIVNVVQLLDPSGGGGGVDGRYPVAVLLAVSPSRRCRKQMVAAGACGFLQNLEVDGAKKLAGCLGRGKMLGVFPRS